MIKSTNINETVYRHLKNFAFLEKDDELRFAPIYDNGLSLGSHLDEDDLLTEEYFLKN
jgi:hypothetical protein